MKRLWMTGLAMGCLASLAAAQEPAFNVSLGAPVALEESSGPVTRVSYHYSATPAKFQDDAPISRPMPVGPADSVFAAGAESTSLNSTFATEASDDEPFTSPLAATPAKRVIARSVPVAASVESADCGDCGVDCDPCDKKLWKCCKLCCNCCPLDPHRLYFSAEYLLWWIKDANTIPLVTTSPFNPAGDPLNSSGILGRPGTMILFQGLDHGTFSGGRFTLGWWTDPCCQSCAFEVSGFFLSERSVEYAANSNQFPVLARPFFQGNGFPGFPGLPPGPGQFSEITARPDLANGSILIDAPTSLWGIEGNIRCNLCCKCSSRLDLLMGVRYLDLEESLTIAENIITVDDSPNSVFPVGTRIQVVDQFATRNQFMGGQLGLFKQYHHNRWSLDLKAKVALGVTHQTVDVIGYQLVQAPGQNVQAFRGGLLALGSNMGHFSRDRFTVVPELGVNVGYDVLPNLRVFAGYTFLYWSSVVRPSDQIDSVLNVNRIPNFLRSNNPGPNRPLMPFKGTDFWAHGVNMGLEYKY